MDAKQVQMRNVNKSFWETNDIKHLYSSISNNDLKRRKNNNSSLSNKNTSAHMSKTRALTIENPMNLSEEGQKQLLNDNS